MAIVWAPFTEALAQEADAPANEMSVHLDHSLNQAPTRVQAWVAATQLPDLVALARLGGGAWCQIQTQAETSQTTTRCLDPQEDREWSPEAWHQARVQARADLRGAMSGELHHHLSHRTSNEPVSAWLWARFEAPPREYSPEAPTTETTALQQGLLAACAALEGCAGQVVVDGPLIEVTATDEALWALARHPLAGAIDHLEPERSFEFHSGVADETMECIRLDEAEAVFSADGTGVKVAVLESDLPDPLVLAEIPQYSGTNCNINIDGWHTGEVMSVIGGDSGGARAIDGSAPGASILMAGNNEACHECDDNYDCLGGVLCDLDSNTCEYEWWQLNYLAVSWAADQGTNVVNASTGSNDWPCNDDANALYDSTSRTLDYWATLPPFPVVTKSTGNAGVGRVSSGATYNGITVGGSDHHQSTTRSSHTIWDVVACDACSSYGTQTECNAQTGCLWFGTCIRWMSNIYRGNGSQGRNKHGIDSLEVPHVVAPANSVLACNLNTPPPPALPAAQWTNSGGTSLAAPHVAGLAARILELDSFLEDYPEAVRAIIMATATENVSGSTLSLNDANDDLDGVGEIDALEAERVASDTTGEHNCWGSSGSPCDDRGINWGQFTSANFNVSGSYYYRDLFFVATEGTAQMVLTWTNNVTCTPSTLNCSGDPVSPMTLAMWLWKLTPPSTWSLVGYSLIPNPEDNYLYIRAPVTPGDTYKVRINYPGLVSGRSTYYGLSWMTY